MQWRRAVTRLREVRQLAPRDASDPERLAPAYNCGDDIHPTALGYDRMGAAVDLKAFR